MNYVTAIYLPSPEWEGRKHTVATTRRFALRWLARLHETVARAIPLIEHNQVLLGDAMTVIVDSNLRSHPNGLLAYEALKKAQINRVEVSMKPMGAFTNKLYCILEALKRRSGPTLWMDCFDVSVLAALDAKEETHINSVLDATGLVCEWEKWRVFGPRMSNSDGRRVCGRAKQPQLSLFCVRDGDLVEAAIATDIDIDQEAMAHVLQERRGLYQDVITPDSIERYSSSGIFHSLPASEPNLLPPAHHPLFGPKLFHKPDEADLAAIQRFEREKNNV